MAADNEMNDTGTDAAEGLSVSAAPQRTPGSLWVAVILAVVGVAQKVLPDADYIVIAAVTLSLNFAVGLLELYMPMFSDGSLVAPSATVDATVRVPLRQVWPDEPAPAGMTHTTAVKKLLIGG